MKVWGFILAIFLFSLLSTTMNEMGILTVHEVEDFNATAMEASSASIKEVITEDSEQSSKSFFEQLPGVDLLYIAVKMFTILFESLKMTALVYFPLVKFGVPGPLALMLQTVVTFMEGIFIFQVWRRFNMEA